MKNAFTRIASHAERICGMKSPRAESTDLQSYEY